MQLGKALGFIHERKVLHEYIIAHDNCNLSQVACGYPQVDVDKKGKIKEIAYI